MNSLERFHATLDRKPVDRPASWLGIPTNEAIDALYAHFGVSKMIGLDRASTATVTIHCSQKTLTVSSLVWEGFFAAYPFALVPVIAPPTAVARALDTGCEDCLTPTVPCSSVSKLGKPSIPAKTMVRGPGQKTSSNLLY